MSTPNTDTHHENPVDRMNSHSLVAPSETESIRILHVDDDPNLVEITRSFLQRESESFDINAKMDPHEAIELIESELSKIDCIVSDYQMPQMDGLELLQVVREHDSDIPFILFTGQGSEDIAAEAIAAGVTDYLQKGGAEAYSILSNRIENLVENYHRQQELDRVHDHYHTLIENGSEIVCVHTADGSIQYINTPVERILGFAPDSLIGENLFKYIHPDDRNRVQRQFSALRSCDGTHGKTVRCRCQNAANEWQWIEASFSDKRISSLDAFVINARDVTPQVERKRELQRQNELFEATQQLASVGGWEYDTRSETLHWTDEVRRIHGVPSEYEPTLQEAIEFYHPDDRDRVREAITSVIEQGEPFNFECRIGTAGDEWKWVRARGEPHFEDGTVVRVRGAVVDITEQREREQRLRMFRSVVENAGHTIYWTDLNGTIEYVNPAFEEITGYDREDAIGAPSSILKSGEHTDEFYESMWETIMGGDTWENEIVNERKNGDHYTVNQTISPVDDGNGEVQHYVAVNQDVSDRAEYESQLNALLEATRTLLRQDSPEDAARVAVDAADDILGLSINGVHLYDEDRSILAPAATTGKAKAVFGTIPTFEPNDSIAWDVFESGEPRIYDDIRTVSGIYNPETAIRSEFHLPLGKHGVYLAGSTTPDAFNDRTVSMAKILAANIEAALDQIDREVELRDTSERIRRQNERLERFAGIVSHDLRNPLTVARTGLELVRKDDGCDPDSLERIDRAHDRMAALIEDLLTLARDGRAVSENDTEQLEISDIVTRAWGTVSTPGAELHVVEGGIISTDGSRLQQLFENLFRNAIDHVGEHVTIRVGMLADGDGFYVEDDGSGISEADREHVFDPGYTTQEDGTGFGLEIVRNISHAHGWTLTLTDSCDGGARFEITTTES